ncbi:hypothetical protein T492DRAFT_896509, partial [Pavlovales sp. CCMP2436]
MWPYHARAQPADAGAGAEPWPWPEAGVGPGSAFSSPVLLLLASVAHFDDKMPTVKQQQPKFLITMVLHQRATDLSPAATPHMSTPTGYGDTLAAATNFQGGHFAKLQHDPVVRAVARFATFSGSMRTEEALLRARAATVDVYVELDQPDGQAAVGHIVEMKTIHYGLTHYSAVAPTRGHA